jgi:LmbE family N-acetylglucosaminyl deacetylase
VGRHPEDAAGLDRARPLAARKDRSARPGRRSAIAAVLGLPLRAGTAGAPLQLLALGAHADDIEIGAGGTLLRLAQSQQLEALVIVLSADARRAAEAQASAAAFLAGCSVTVQTHDLPDGRFPSQWNRVKEILEDCVATWTPDVVLAPSRSDAHQDHRILAGLVPTVFRNHLVLEYEIPKWDGDLSQPSAYVPLSDDVVRRKFELLWEHFASQRERDWFDAETFRGLARLRGIECRASYAEAFGCRKLVLSPCGG